MQARIWTAARLAYGLFFAAMGVLVFAKITPMDLGAPNILTPPQIAFMTALRATGFMDPLLGASYLFGGLALLARRSTPLGVVVLAPPVTVILLFHAALSPRPWIGLVVAGFLALIAWDVRGSLAVLWTARDARPN